MTAPGFILNGELIEEGSCGELELLNPSSGALIATLPRAGKEEAEVAATLSKQGFEKWSALTAFDRGRVLRRAADLMREKADAAAADMTREQGKPLAQSRSEWLLAADGLDWFAEEARRAYGRLIPPRAPQIEWAVHARPVGPVAALTPWNFPAWTVMQKVAPALAAGCSVVLKPSEDTPTTAFHICRCLIDAGLPKEAISLIWGNPADISDTLLGSAEIVKVSYTGSARVGRIVSETAGRNLKKTTMELGGHAPVIVSADVDVERVARLAVEWKFRNAGQVCVSPTRFLIEAPVYDRFVSAMAAATELIRVGDGMDEETDMGPLATPDQVRKVSDLVEDAGANAAEIVTGGRRLDRNGCFFEPTIIAGTTEIQMRILNEEPFGPVAIVMPYSTLDAAIAEANRLPVGLASYAFTNDRRVEHEITSRINAGMLAINHFALATPETPFGGVQESGHGSEGGSEGLGEYMKPLFVSGRSEIASATNPRLSADRKGQTEI